MILAFGTTVVHLEERDIEVKGALQSSDFDSFDLVQRKLLSGAVVELCRPGRFVFGDGLGVLEGPAVLQVCGDARSSKGVAAGGVGKGGRLSPPLDHMEDVEPRHRLVR